MTRNKAHTVAGAILKITFWETISY